jgi:uncharacterized protein (TIGR03083 family)
LPSTVANPARSGGRRHGREAANDPVPAADRASTLSIRRPPRSRASAESIRCPPQIGHLPCRSVATLTHLGFVDALRREAAQVSALLAAADLAAPVPSCPGWQVRDLVDHLGGVHRWTTEIVRTGERARFPDSPAGADLVRWFDDGAERLAKTLTDAEPTRACWTMAPPQEVVFWSRRQAHEAMVHRWDLATALGAPADLDPALASDGIDEAVLMFFPRQIALGRQARLTDSVALVEVGSGRRWVLQSDGTATDHDSADVDATVSGGAAALLLLLWQRVDLAESAVDVDGDGSAARRVLGAQLTP